MTQDFSSRPNRIPWPPLIYVLAAFAGYFLLHLLPVEWPLPSGISWLVGLILIGVGLAIDGTAILSFWRHKTAVLPHHAAQRLISTGLYRWSRNPIYVAYNILLAGLALAMGNIWLLVALPFALYAVTKLAIEREEAHLAARFGASWADYCRRVPRWFGVPAS